MNRRFYIFSALALSISLLAPTSAMRIKDIATLEGRRDNQLVGYGLIVGLAGNGDSNQAIYTLQSIANMMQRFGVSIDPDDITASNVAAVMITADIPAYVEAGTRIDVTVSSIGDADSLEGGVLLQTPLMGADDQVYAVAQGSMLLGGFFAGGDDASVQRNHPTVATIPEGAIVERTIRSEVIHDNSLNVLLRNPDFASAVKLAERVNDFFPGSAEAMTPQSVKVSIPEAYAENPVTFIASLESIEVEPDVAAKVIMNERTGTIVTTAAVRLSEVAVSHGNLTVSIARTPVVSQPDALSEGETVVEETTEVNAVEERTGFARLNSSPTLEDLTTTLNTLGVSPRDMMVILQTIDAAGALHAELILQ
ncbi:MAG: flagellar basal body P-ring protein FlgI [Opitutales bacterium]